LLSEAYTSYGAVGCYAFTFETREASSFVHARFFAPSDNIPEDAATGSAAGALSGYLVEHGCIDRPDARLTMRTDGSDSARLTGFTIEQGDFMLRPSRIFAQVTGEPGNIQRVQIGGSSVVVAKGELYVE
jgi:trans-2,3-dihydro-3-hydroxyanthranilate isomerase